MPFYAALYSKHRKDSGRVAQQFGGEIVPAQDLERLHRQLREIAASDPAYSYRVVAANGGVIDPAGVPAHVWAAWFRKHGVTVKRGEPRFPLQK